MVSDVVGDRAGEGGGVRAAVVGAVGETSDEDERIRPGAVSDSARGVRSDDEATGYGS
jgi:hypothetical protein